MNGRVSRIHSMTCIMYHMLARIAAMELEQVKYENDKTEAQQKAHKLEQEVCRMCHVIW